MRVEIKWAIIIFIAHALWHVAERFMGLYGLHYGWQEIASLLFLAAYAGLMFVALFDLRKSNNGHLNRRHGFVSAFFISLILVAAAPITVALLAFVIQPDFFLIMIENSMRIGEYSAYELAEQEYSYWAFVKLYMIGYMLVGTLSGALWAYVLHKMPEPVQD